jgi:hypothetical protein
MITLREIQEIKQWVLNLLASREASYMTDRKVDLGKPMVGIVQQRNFDKGFTDLNDTPSVYGQIGHIPTIADDGISLEWKPYKSVDGGGFAEDHSGAVELNQVQVDAGSFTTNVILDAGGF